MFPFHFKLDYFQGSFARFIYLPCNGGTQGGFEGYFISYLELFEHLEVKKKSRYDAPKSSSWTAIIRVRRYLVAATATAMMSMSVS